LFALNLGTDGQYYFFTFVLILILKTSVFSFVTMKYLATFMLFFSFLLTKAQKHELGFSLGGSNYKGDFTNDNFELKNYRPAVLIFYKNNITPAFGIRYHLMAGGIKANDAKSSDAVYNVRSLSVKNTLFEGAAQIEYNFINYRSASNRLKWSPYFLAGLGVFYFPPYSNSSELTIQPCIPIGVGIKCMIFGNWNLGLEVAARKTFTDLLDNTNGSIIGGNGDTQDWYIYNGVSLSYNFYNVYCPKP